jgi:hypothetical protein
MWGQHHSGSYCYTYRTLGCKMAADWLRIGSMRKLTLRLGRAMAQAVSRRSLIAEARVRARAIHSMWDLWWRECYWRVFSSSCSAFPSVSFHWRSMPISHLGGEQQACWWPQFADVVSPHRHKEQQERQRSSPTKRGTFLASWATINFQETLCSMELRASSKVCDVAVATLDVYLQTTWPF